MKKIFIAFCLLCTVALAADLRQLVIAIPRSYAVANPAKVKKVVRNVWGDEVSEAWANQGWITMWRNGDSNQVWYLYVVTLHQIKNIATPEKIQQWKDWLDDNPQIKVQISNDWMADARENNLDYPPEAIP
jgi:hypothetical protein